MDMKHHQIKKMKSGFAALSLWLFASGCFMYPDCALKQWGIKGRLIDKETLQPLAKTKIAVSIDGQIYRKTTDKSGQIEISPKYQLYITWSYCGPVLVPAPLPVRIGFSVAEYKETKINVTYDTDTRTYDQFSVMKCKDEKDYFILGNIEMKRSRKVDVSKSTD